MDSAEQVQLVISAVAELTCGMATVDSSYLDLTKREGAFQLASIIIV